MLGLLYHISELQAFLVACYYYRYLRGSFMRWFVPFLGFVFFADSSMYFQIKVKLPVLYPTITLYLLMISQTIFYGCIFYKLKNDKILRRIVVLMWCICIPVYLLSFFLANNETSKSMLVPAIVSNIFTAVIALYYLYLMIIGNDTIHLGYEFSWWLGIGVSTFFSCVSIGYLLFDFILRNKLVLFGNYLYNTIPQLGSLILYSFISISIFLYAKKVKQETAFPC
jgi:hypothetical protein